MTWKLIKISQFLCRQTLQCVSVIIEVWTVKSLKGFLLHLLCNSCRLQKRNFIWYCYFEIVKAYEILLTGIVITFLFESCKESIFLKLYFLPWLLVKRLHKESERISFINFAAVMVILYSISEIFRKLVTAAIAMAGAQ